MATPTDWKAEEERWRNGINVQTATDKDLTDFTLFKLWEYNDFKAIDNGLWTLFQDDFKVFSVDIFLRVHAQHLQSIYAFLRRGGVYMHTKQKRTTYAQLLFKLIQEEHQYSWTQENLDEVYIELNEIGFQSNKMNNTLKHSLNYKVSQDPTVRITLFQLQPASVQTTTLRPQTAPLPQQLSSVQTARLPLSRRAPVGPLPHTTSPQRLPDVQTASLPLSGEAPVGPSPIPSQPQ